MEYKYKNVHSGRKIMLEREDNVSACQKYLRKIKTKREFQSQGRNLPGWHLNQWECLCERLWTDTEGRAGQRPKPG